MGRSKNVTGPYIDNRGVELLKGGGKLVVAASGRFVGPGHFGLLDLGDGVPMVALNYTEHLIHALYPEYAKIAWDFAKHYSRDQKTGAIKYNPYIK